MERDGVNRRPGGLSPAAVAMPVVAAPLLALSVAATLVVALAIPAAAAVGTEEPPSPTEEAASDAPPTEAPGEAERIRRLEESIRLLEEAHRRQIRELEGRIEALEAELGAPLPEGPVREGPAQKAPVQEGEDDELAALLAEAEALTEEERQQEVEAAKERDSFTGRERSLQALNPEVSFLGNVSYDWTRGPTKDGFLLRGAELALQAPLDPYTRFKAFIVGHQEPFALPPPADHEHPEDGEENEHEEEGHAHSEEIAVAVEEAYMEWVALPLNTRLRVGKFRQQYGTLNRWHPHALPSVDTPFALRNIFGHEGLIGLGVGLDWQLPKLWATANGLTVEITNAENPSAFAGADWRDPALLLRHTGFFEIGDDAYLDLGLSWMRGANDASGDRHTTLAGVDFTYVWEPVNRAKYRNVELRGEYIHSRFDTEEAPAVSADSFYAYLSTKVSRRWTLGLRYDYAELPSDRLGLYHPEEFQPGLRETAWSPFVTFWQSEFVRLRLQYQHADRDFSAPQGGESGDKAWLQVTFAAGPHKHDTY